MTGVVLSTLMSPGISSLPQGVQLHERLPELQLIYDTAPIGLAFLTPDCRYVQINQRLTEICGISVSAHIGRTVRETVPQVAAQVEAIVDIILRTGEPVQGIEVNGQRADKRNADHVWITNWHPLKGADGSIIGINVVAEDVTERKRAEAELSASEKSLRELNETLEQRVEAETHERLQIWNVSQDLLVISDLAGQCLSLNPAWTATLGWPEQELLKKSPQWLVHADDRERTRAETQHVAAGGKVLFFENRLLHKDGSYRWISWKAVADQGRIYAMGRDATELKDAEDRLRGARRQLAHMARHTTMATMTASIAHEIRQPLGAIVANANAGLRWLNKTPPGLDEARETFGDIVADGHRANQVVQSIRAMFQKSEPKGRLLRLNGLIQETIAILRADLDAANVTLRTALAAQLPAVHAHKGQLQQVVLNIITNAIDAMRTVSDRERILRVRSTVLTSGDVELSIEDTGTGIPPADMERIFDTFFTTKSDGMGMGLAICRSIVEAHDGALSVCAREPHGTTFSIVLPRNQ